MSFPRPTAFALLLSCLAVEPSPGRTGEIAKGADVGWLQQMVDPGQGGGPFQFYDSDGRQRDPDQATNCFKILRERHIDTIRFRVFVPPVTQPYWDNQLAGHCTIEEVAPVAAKAAALGLRILIDLHYSWTFADPGNQRLPVNWANEISGLSTADAIDKVASEVTAHTADVLAKLKAVGVTPEWVQVGNEITNGMLSEIQNNTNVAAVGTGFGSRSNMPSFVRFINAGYDAVKAADPNIKVIIHIDRAHNDGLDKGFFSSLKASGGKWDVSGTDVSGGLFSDIQYTVNDLAASFNTPGAGGDGVMMCEIEPPNEYGRNNNQFNPYPDFDFVTNILNIMRAIPNGKGVGAVYWEAQADPDWRGYQQSAFANHEPSPSLDAFLPSIPRASGTNIIGGDGQPLQLRGVNLGGWLVMEPWMTPADSSGLPDEYGIVQKLDTRFGVATEQSLINTYRQNWITTQDLDNIKARGLNVVRVPVWWGDFYPLSALGSPTAPALRADAFALLDWLVRQASERGIYTVIDMHGVFGGQSASASTGQANSNAYWASASNQANTQSMWAAIAAHFRGNAWVAGYDLLNEPDGAPSQQAALTQLNNLYAAVRAADPDHLIFLEGTFGHAYKAQWGWGALPSPASQGWTNVAYEMHEYQFNATDANVQRGADNQVADFNGHKAAYDVPCYIGEFNDFGYGDAWGHSVGAFNADGMGWSSWSYKATHGPGPDSWGLYDPNGAWTTVPNIATDSSGAISADWSKWTTANTFSSNPLLSGVLIGPPAITSLTQAAVASGAAFAYTITATDSPTSFGAANLPAGLSVNTATGLISGTPPANGGSFNIGLSAVTSGGACAATLRLVVTTTGNYPTITSANAAGGVVGGAFGYQTAVRNGPASFAATGLPAGLSINKTTGLISGTPTAAGQTNVTLSATNGTGTVTQELALTVTFSAPVITSATSASGTAGTAFSYTVTASNVPASFAASGLPAGLNADPATGVIAGTPIDAGTFNVTLRAANAGGAGTASLTLKINRGMVSFNTWETKYFNTTQMGNPATSGPTATPQGDGVVNLLKYLCDINPSRPMSAADRAALPQQGTTADGTNLTLTYRQYINAAGVTVTLQSSTDLTTWTNVTGASPTVVGTDAATGDPMVQMKVPVTPPRQFIRLNIVGP